MTFPKVEVVRPSLRYLVFIRVSGIHVSLLMLAVLTVISDILESETKRVTN